MSRRRRSEERVLIQDEKYKSTLITQFVNKMMYDGKKSTALTIIYGALDRIKETNKDVDPFHVFSEALKNVSPAMEVKSRRVGGATYQVPIEIRKKRRTALAIKWIIASARSRSGKSMIDKLSKELVEASELKGAAVKKKDDTHKMAEANKAFSHFRW